MGYPDTTMGLKPLDTPQSEDGLLQIVKAARIKGKSYMDIERIYGISAPRAEALVKAYYRGRAAAIDPNEERMLMMERLEALIEPLMDMAQMGNVKSAEALTKTLESINTLLGLNLEQTKIEITVVTQRQTTVIYEIVDEVSRALLAHAQANVTDQKQLAIVEDTWDEVVADSYHKKADALVDTELIVSG